MNGLCVFATSRVPEGTRGALNQWLTEVLPGIFVGRVSARVRGELWDILQRSLPLEDAYAALIAHDTSEQGYTISRVGDHAYMPTEFDGLQLITITHRLKEETGTSSDVMDEFDVPW